VSSVVIRSAIPRSCMRGRIRKRLIPRLPVMAQLFLIVFVALAAVTPSTAGATNVGRDGSFLNISGSVGEINSVVISIVGDHYVISDTGSLQILIDPGSTQYCNSTPSPQVVTCNVFTGDTLAGYLLDGNDWYQDATSTPSLVRGGTGDDTLIGGSGADTLVGDEGSDAIEGGDGNDLVLGESFFGESPPASPGRDVVEGGSGDDIVFGGEGDNFVSGGAGSDTIAAFSGNDILKGGDGNDALLGYTGADSLSGEGGSDELGGGDGDDSLLGGEGDDILGVTFAVSGQVVSGEAGNDTIDGGPGDDVLNGGPGSYVANYGATIQTRIPPIEASETSSTNGSDSVIGGDGHDTATYENRSASVVVKLDGSPNDGSGHEGDSVESDVEKIVGGSKHDILVGGGGGVTLEGAGGDDVLLGGVGNDVLQGESGNDILSAGDGNDSLQGGSENDDLEGNGGSDTLDGGGGEDFVDGGLGKDALLGGKGADTLRSRGRSDERVDCGPDKDFAIAERRTKLKNCESADRSSRSVRQFLILRRVGGNPGVELPGAHRFVPLWDHLNLSGSFSVNTNNRGVVRLVSRESQRNSGAFYGGAFSVAQASRSTNLRLISDPKACARGRAVDSKRRLVVQSLWADAGRGFRVAGRFSTGAGNNALWLTQDRCDGTLTRVVRGRIAVIGRHNQRVIVTAGHEYLVRAR
jgi:Ca2+-binding RTX toxin-like protein